MRALLITLLIAQGSACILLVVKRLAWRLPALAAYLGFSVVRGLALVQFSIYDTRYRDLWIATLPVVIALQVATAVEAYRYSLEELPGARRHAHWVIIGLSVLTAAAAQIPQRTYTPYGVISLANQAVGTVLAVTAVMMTALLNYLKPRRRRNAIWHERILAAHFSAMALSLGLVHLGILGWPGVANGLVSIACCLAWMLLLTRDGDELHPSPPVSGSGDFSPLRTRLLEVLSGGR